MTRPTHVIIDRQALWHNLQRVKALAPGRAIIAMVKADAYGCGIDNVLPLFDGAVDAYGVACMAEAEAIRRRGSLTEVILFQGVFDEAELEQALDMGLTLVVHNARQVDWLAKRALPKDLKLWIKINTGMNRLGFAPEAFSAILSQLKSLKIKSENIGLMTHFACADTPAHPQNQAQISCFQTLLAQAGLGRYSAANSAVIFNFPKMHLDAVRPGIMLYGVSPMAGQTGQSLGLKPVMRFFSAISAIHDIPAGAAVGYGADWVAEKRARVAVIPVGYGDGYPRHLRSQTYVSLHQQKVPLCGRVSMDMMTIDISNCPQAKLGDPVELWGTEQAIEQTAEAAGTIAYELLVKMTARAKRTYG